MAKRPLEGSYVSTLGVALFALVPYILVVSGANLYRAGVIRDLGATHGALSVIGGISTAGYAFGALLAGDLNSRIPQRRLFFACESLFIVGWMLCAVAGGTVTYGAGRVLAGFATGTLLVTAIPPVVQRFPPSRMPLTAAFINVGFFGAIAGGPLLGGAVGAFDAWRWMYAGFAAVGVFTVAIAFLALPTTPPPNPDLKVDYWGIGLGLAAAALPFFASGELAAHGFGTAVVTAPLAVGVVAFLVMLLVEYHRREPLAPVKKMWSTIPVVGTLVAMIGGGAFVTFVILAVEYLLAVMQRGPLPTGLSFWPQLLGALITAGLLGVLFRTRFLPLLAFGGQLVLLGGGALLMFYQGGSRAQLLAAVGLLGLGAGATVSPGLFLAGMSLPTLLLGRLFALIELVRSVADFILAPVMVKIAKVTSAGSGLTSPGVHRAILITLLITLAGLAISLAIYAAGRTGLPKPDLEAWIKRKQTALKSPPLGQGLRGRV